MQNSKVQLQKLIANIKIVNVKVKFLIDTGSSANILCYETLTEISKLKMKNHKLKKTSVKLIPFGSRSQNSFISVKGALSVLLETEEHFADAIFYAVRNNITNIINGNLAIQLGILTLHNKATSKFNSQARSTNNIFLGNDSKNKVTEKLLNKYHKVFEDVGKYNKDQFHLFINDKVLPVTQKARRIPYKMREKVLNELEMIRKQNIIEDIKDQQTPWIITIRFTCGERKIW